MREPFLPPVIYHRVHTFWLRLLRWRERHIKEKSFVILLSLVVGVLAGLAAMVLKWMIHLISGTLTADLNVSEGNYLYILYPVIDHTFPTRRSSDLYGLSASCLHAGMSVTWYATTFRTA